MQFFLTLRAVRFENLAGADAIACLLAAWQMGRAVQLVILFLYFICHSSEIQKLRCVSLPLNFIREFPLHP